MQSQIKPFLFAAALLTLTSAALADDRNGDGVLTAKMVVDLARVSEVALSSDGATVAYTLEVPRDEDDEPGRSYKQLWLAGAESGEPRRFIAGKERVGAPAFSPDGKLVSFLVEREEIQEGTQIWGIPKDGGEARLLSRHDGSISSYRWSPDGTRIAYAATDAESEEEKQDKEAGRDWVVENAEPGSPPTADTAVKFRHLHVLDVASGDSRRLTRDDLDAFEIHWTPDGQALVFQATTTGHIDDEYMNSAIYSLAAGGGTARVVTSTDGKLADMALSPDGAHLAWLGAVSRNDPLAQSVFVVPLAGGEAREVFPGRVSGATTAGYEGSAARRAWRSPSTASSSRLPSSRQARRAALPS